LIQDSSALAPGPRIPERKPFLDQHRDMTLARAQADLRPAASVQEPRFVPEPPADSPAALAGAAARGDRAAFDRLHVRFSGGLRKLFLSRVSGRADLADDLAQRTWLACWRSLSAGRYDPQRAAFSTFLYAVGTNIWREHLRARARTPERSDSRTAADDELSIPHEDEQDLAELLDALRACLRGEGADALDEEDRWILRSVAAGASDRVMAQRLGVAPSTMNARKRSALEHLRRWLASRGYRPEPPERE
jgi:RNA polymerase sigma-70 factor (ECF subfamily)